MGPKCTSNTGHQDNNNKQALLGKVCSMNLVLLEGFFNDEIITEAYQEIQVRGCYRNVPGAYYRYLNEGLGQFIATFW